MHDRSRGSLEQLWELMAKEVTALERLFDIALELGLVLDHQLRGLLVERVIGIGLQEQRHQAEEYGAKGQHGLPVRAQNVQADTTVPINVRVIDLHY